jgi:hypothetical protein
VQLAPLIEEVVGTARQLAQQNQNHLIFEVQEDLGAITIHPRRLRQILLNPIEQCLQVHQRWQGFSSAITKAKDYRRPAGGL